MPSATLALRQAMAHPIMATQSHDPELGFYCANGRQAIVPSATLALYHAMAYLAGKLGHTRLWQRTGARLHAWLLARQVRSSCF